MIRFASSILVLASLMACSSKPTMPNYACPLDGIDSGKCASMEEAYKASRSMSKNPSVKVQTVFDPRVQPGTATEAAPMFNGQLSDYPDPGQTGMPVFQQPKVMRVWVAPYVDADGNLRSGEFTYFSTPGSWNYGTLNKSGAASGIFEPNKPDNLGFKPVIVPKTTKAPSAPPEKGSGSSQGSSPAATTTTSDGITQPYKRLAN